MSGISSYAAPWDLDPGSLAPELSEMIHDDQSIRLGCAP